MEVKTLEIRDCGTFIPVMAINLNPREESERWLFARAGYGPTPEVQSRYVVLVKLTSMECRYEPDDWAGITTARTMPTAHQHIIENWHDLTTGDVIDVEYILEETTVRKDSERLGPEPHSRPPHSTYTRERWREGLG